jgi:hypothetical protein
MSKDSEARLKKARNLWRDEAIETLKTLPKSNLLEVIDDKTPLSQSRYVHFYWVGGEYLWDIDNDFVQSLDLGTSNSSEMCDKIYKILHPAC